MKTISLQDLASERINRKFTESKKPYQLDTFLDPIFYLNKVNIFTAENRADSSLALFNVITKIIKKTDDFPKAVYYHVCLEENLSDISNQYLAHYGNERLRNIKNKNYEINQDTIKMPPISFVVLKNNQSVEEIKTVMNTITRINNHYTFIFLEGIDKSLTKMSRTTLLKDIFDHLDKDESGVTVLASIKTDPNLKGYYHIPVEKEEEFIKYTLKNHEYYFKVDVDFLNFYPSNMGYLQTIPKLELLNSSQISFKDKILMNHFLKKDSAHISKEQKIKEFSKDLILISSRIVIGDSSLFKEEKRMPWMHFLVSNQPEFGEREYYAIQSEVQPQEHLILVVERDHLVDPNVKSKQGAFFHINTLNNMKDKALEEDSFKKRQQIIIPSPKLDGFNKNSGKWSPHPTFGYDFKLRLPLFLYGKQPHLEATKILVKYKKINPNTHIYIGGLIDKSSYHLGDENNSLLNFSSYNEDTFKRLIEYLHEEYINRCQAYNKEKDADKILYLSEIEELKHLISFNEDNNQYSVGLKLKQLMRQANMFGIFVIASSCIETKKQSSFFNLKEEFFEFEKTISSEEIKNIKNDKEFVLSIDYILNNLIGEGSIVENKEHNYFVLHTEEKERKLVYASSKSKLSSVELNTVKDIASIVNVSKTLLFSTSTVTNFLYQKANESGIQIIDLDELFQIKKI